MERACIYTKPNCNSCLRLKELLQAKGIAYTEIVLDYGQGPDPGDTRSYIHPTEFQETFPAVQVLPFIVLDGYAVGTFGQFLQMVASGEPYKCPSC